MWNQLEVSERDVSSLRLQLHVANSGSLSINQGHACINELEFAARERFKCSQLHRDIVNFCKV